jgi:hypothetical protein
MSEKIELAERAIAQSLLAVLRTMGDGTLQIRETEHGFKAEVVDTYSYSAECDRHLANLSVAINYAPR